MPNRILQGNVTDKLKELETGTVQCVVTSPPYWGLRDYGTASWEGGDDDCDHIDFNRLAERKRQKKSMIAVGERTDGSTRTRIHDSEIGKQWQYLMNCKKCGAKRIDNQLGLEETPEEYVAKMVEVFKEIKRVLKKDGTVWLNLGDSYSASSGTGGTKSFQPKQPMFTYTRKAPKNIKPKDLVGIPWRVAFALQDDGWYLRQDIIWHKPNPMPESVTDRCTKAHEYIFLLSKSARYYYDNDAIREPAKDWGKRNRDYFRNGTQDKYLLHRGLRDSDFKDKGANKRSVWTINVKPYKEAHFAVFPQKLPELCIKAGSKEDDIILDPFFGSGTTGYMAQKLSRRWIGIELNEEYIKIAKKRLAQQEMFAAK